MKTSWDRSDKIIPTYNYKKLCLSHKHIFINSNEMHSLSFYTFFILSCGRLFGIPMLFYRACNHTIKQSNRYLYFLIFILRILHTPYLKATCQAQILGPLPRHHRRQLAWAPPEQGQNVPLSDCPKLLRPSETS